MLSSDHFNGNAEPVRKQLLKILSSHEFKNSHVVSRFFEFVVEEALACRAKEIKEYTIGVKALGKPADFNPQFEAVVRIHAGRLRRMLREYYNGNGSSDPLLIDIPKGSYVPVFESLNTTNIAQANVKSTNGVGKENDNGLYHKATVAVFPFHNLSADDSKNYFAEGIGEQLCIELARFEHLSVISYYSTYKLAAETDGREMHKLFDIDYAIMGSTRFFDGLVQVNVQLMLAESNAVLWAESFTRQFDPNSVLTLQQDILGEVLYKVADHDGIIAKNIANSAPAKKKIFSGVYDAVYLYFSFRGRYDTESFNEAKVAVEKAATLDPNNALIWALLSRLCINSYIHTTYPEQEDLQKGKALAEKSLLLDGNCQYAYKALAWCHLLTGRTNDCKQAIDRCLHLNPNAPSILGNMGFLNICIGKYSEGFRLLLEALPSHPMLPWYCEIGFALYYYYAGKYEEAYAWAKKAQSSGMQFITLVKLATQQKIKPRKNDAHQKASPISREITGRAAEIVSLFIHDPDLRERLLKELQSSGVVVE
jgi:TolB-like protein